jgi:hypothetical protein
MRGGDITAADLNAAANTATTLASQLTKIADDVAAAGSAAAVPDSGSSSDSVVPVPPGSGDLSAAAAPPPPPPPSNVYIPNTRLNLPKKTLTPAPSSSEPDDTTGSSAAPLATSEPAPASAAPSVPSVPAAPSESVAAPSVPAAPSESVAAPSVPAASSESVASEPAASSAPAPDSYYNASNGNKPFVISGTNIASSSIKKILGNMIASATDDANKQKLETILSEINKAQNGQAVAKILADNHIQFTAAKNAFTMSGGTKKRKMHKRTNRRKTRKMKKTRKTRKMKRMLRKMMRKTMKL